MEADAGAEERDGGKKQESVALRWGHDAAIDVEGNCREPSAMRAIVCARAASARRVSRGIREEWP
jgi:hypothetical protein